MDPLRILIADDHPLFRDGVRMLLDAIPDMQVVGEAATGEEAVDLARSLNPDVILMDIRMPGLNGLEATHQILADTPSIRILVVTMFEDDASVFAAMRAGARGYMLKDSGKEDMLRAIRAVGQGEAIFSPGVASRLVNFFSTAGSSIPRAAFPNLTSRESEILQLMIQGESNAGIARTLGLSGKTIANYVSNILNKLQVADREEAIHRARSANQDRPSSPVD